MLNIRFHMDINRIKLFSTIAETGNMRRAAEFHKMSPGALSKAMKQLETELGVKVFAQVGRGIALTDAGRRLYASSGRLLQEFDLLKKSVEAPGEDAAQRILRVGSFEVFTTYCLSWMAEQFFEERPILCQELTPGKIEAALLDRSIDIGLTYAPMPHEELDFLPAAEFESRVFVRSSVFHGKRLEEIPFAVPITPIGRSPINIQSLDGWPSDWFSRSVKYRFELLETALQFCSRGLAALYCPAFVVKIHNEMTVSKYRLEPHPLPKWMKSEKQALYVVKRKAELESSEIKLLAKALRLVCR